MMLATLAFGQFQADSIFIYKRFSGHGTTAKLWKNHRYLDSINSEKTMIEEADLIAMRDIFAKTKNKRFYQQKHGGPECYALIFKNGRRYNYVFEGTDKWGRLINLTKRRSLTIDPIDSLDSKKLNFLKKKYWP